MKRMKAAMGMRIILFIVMFHMAIYFTLPEGTAYDFGLMNRFVNLDETTNTLQENETIANTIYPNSTSSDFIGGSATIFVNTITMAMDAISLLIGLATAPLALLNLGGIPFAMKVIIGVPLAIMYLLAILAWWKGNEI